MAAADFMTRMIRVVAAKATIEVIAENRTEAFVEATAAEIASATARRSLVEAEAISMRRMSEQRVPNEMV